ncbi:hypothetical protein BDF22DRAFT_698351 [Syncephalis plumigaleata]|nr:hypothetical protein BDF22DRAFT_698351 [Syncephalis plumigaleata]
MLISFLTSLFANSDTLKSHPIPPGEPGFLARCMLVGFLVLLGGLIAGLTLGLMSLNATSLHILANGGTPQQRKWAARIQPIRANGHLLLVTLLLTNTLINEALPIVMDSIIGGGLVAILASTGLIFVFGEIIPQSICARHGLRIGAFFACYYVIAYPISKLLDYMLGAEHEVIYQRAELKELVAFHSDLQHGDLMHDEVTIIRGALDMQGKRAADIMTPVEDIFMISVDSCLDRALLTRIVETGHSRIPVFDGQRDNISLILLDPDDATLMSSMRLNMVSKVNIETPAFDLLNAFQEGNSHMAVVQDNHKQIVGVITLEDVIEELIQEEIVDETDVYVDMHTKLKVARAFKQAINRQPSLIRNARRSARNPDKSHRPRQHSEGNVKVDMMDDATERTWLLNGHDNEDGNDGSGGAATLSVSPSHIEQGRPRKNTYS